MNSKRIPVKQITSWSYSRYLDYKQCPLKAKLKHIDKIKEPLNDAMARGIEIHNEAEDYIKGKIPRLPPTLREFKALFQRLRKTYKKVTSGMVVEDNWAFTKDWDETAWNDWTYCWVRIKLDCAEYDPNDFNTIIIRDWKTGKFRPDNQDDYIEQLGLYALAALLLYPDVEKVKPSLVYVDHGIVYPESGSAEEAELTFTHADIPRLKKLWAKNTKPMLNDKKFAPRPNHFCSWCFYRKANKANGGGQCKF